MALESVKVKGAIHYTIVEGDHPTASARDFTRPKINIEGDRCTVAEFKELLCRDRGVRPTQVAVRVLDTATKAELPDTHVLLNYSNVAVGVHRRKLEDLNTLVAAARAAKAAAEATARQNAEGCGDADDLLGDVLGPQSSTDAAATAAAMPPSPGSRSFLDSLLEEVAPPAAAPQWNIVVGSAAAAPPPEVRTEGPSASLAGAADANPTVTLSSDILAQEPTKVKVEMGTRRQLVVLPIAAGTRKRDREGAGGSSGSACGVAQQSTRKE